jgi:hypothetical protein
MNMHEADIRGRLTRFLDRKQMPKRLEGKGGAMEDEISALTQAVLRNAPRSTDRLAEWWPHFEAALGETAMGGLWPTEREIRDAAKSVSVKASSVAAPPEQKTELQIVADRMSRGDPVAEGWLYGRAACEIIAARMVDEPTMRRYRSAAFMARKDAYGEAAALEWERQAKQRHAEAREAFKDRTPHHGPGPDISAKHFGGEAA